MEYRKLASGEKVGVIGFGAGKLRDSSDEEIKKLFEHGIGEGMNFMDTVSVEETFAKPIKEVLKDFREDMIIQMHIGAVYPNGQYTQSRDLDEIRKSFETELVKYGCDYADYGMIHYVDTMDDYNIIMNEGIYDYAVELKDNGIINHIGLSSHTPDICDKFIDDVDLIMLSINPSFDFESKNGKLNISSERFELYKKCQQNNVDLSVMKAFGGGKLLNKELSPLSVELTTGQCIKYALDRPAVKVVLPGFANLDELKSVLNYFNADKDDLDYNFIGELTESDVKGNCIYCNHCRPCSAGIEIGLVNKLYDLAKIGDGMARDHYLSLNAKASDCIGCGNCEITCSFGVAVIDNMSKISEYFGV